MVENNQEIQAEFISAVAIARARDAATECVCAVKASEHVDYRLYLAHLYRSLRLGWDRIGRVCPQLVKAYPRYFLDPDVLSEYRTDPLVFAWLLACEWFWSVIEDTPHALWALGAWVNWQETYAPNLWDYPKGDGKVWGGLCRGSWRRGSAGLNYDVLLAEINEAFPAKSTWSGLVDRPLPPPATLLRPEPWPGEPWPREEAELRRLHEKLAEVVAELNNIWDPFSSTLNNICDPYGSMLRSQRQDTQPTRAAIRELLRGWPQEFSIRFTRIGSRFHIPPLKVAITRARFAAACWELTRGVQDNEPVRTNVEFYMLVHPVIESGTALLNTATGKLRDFHHILDTLDEIRAARTRAALPAISPSEEDQDQTNSDVPDDPITLEQAARLVGQTLKTLYNNKDKRPKPAIGGGKGELLVFSYKALRPWLRENWPGMLYRLSENYEETKKYWAEPTSPQQQDAAT